METTRKRRIFRLIAFVLPAFLIVFAGLVLGVRELWNWLMPDIFGLRTITYWQALGLMVLSWFLFRGEQWTSLARAAASLALVVTLVTLGGLLEQRRWAPMAEAIRLLVVGAAVVVLLADARGVATLAGGAAAGALIVWLLVSPRAPARAPSR